MKKKHSKWEVAKREKAGDTIVMQDTWGKCNKWLNEKGKQCGFNRFEDGKDEYFIHPYIDTTSWEFKEEQLCGQ